MAGWFDTIVAPITPPGVGGVSVVRVSGPEAWSVATSVFANWPLRPCTHHAVFGKFANGDEGLALPFAEGHGYTGDEAVEFSIHGSPASVRSLVQACRDAGARLAEPGEFSMRAFQNGKLDLAEAEGVLATVEAQTNLQLQAANQMRGGSLSAAVGEIRAVLVGVLVEIEARVDFSEEVGPLDRELALGELARAADKIEMLTAGAQAARLVQDGLRVAIVGPPNAGKSSLLNALLNYDRAIVTPIAGTTRDVIEERLDVGGCPVVLIDTAGLRETDDLVELLGVQRSRMAAAQADAVWYVYDAATGWTDDDDAVVTGLSEAVLIIANKMDVAPTTHGLPVSALARTGLGALTDWIVARFDVTESVTPINDRHAALLGQASESVRDAIDTLTGEMPEDLASIAIQDALDSLGQITGVTTTPDLIHEVFARFCIGK